MTQGWETRPDAEIKQSKPRRRPWLLPVTASVGTALLTAGTVFAITALTGDSDEPPGSASPEAQVPPASPTAVAPQPQNIRITQIPDICTVVPATTLATLVPDAEEPQSEPLKQSTEKSSMAYCEWTTGYNKARAIQKERTLRVRLSLFTDPSGAIDKLEFDRGLARTRSNTENKSSGDLLKVGPYLELQSVGDEAFAQQTDQSGHGRSTPSITLWSRYKNVTIEVEYNGTDSPTTGQGKSTPLDPQLLRSGVETATREAIMKLQN